MPGGSSAATATPITALPYSDSDTVPTTAGLWYQYTAPVGGPNMVSVFPYAATLSNQRLRVFSPDAVTPYPASTPSITNSKPLQVAVAPDVTYYFNVYNQVGPYTLTVQAGPRELAPVGSILVPNDVPDYPAALLSGTDGHALRFRHPFAVGETADVLPAGPYLGRILAHNRILPSGGDGHLRLYSPQLDLLADLPYVTGGSSYTAPIRIGRTSQQFYVAQQADPLNAGHGSVTTVTGTGTFGPTTWNLSSAWAIGLVAPSVDETVLFGARLSFGSARIVAAWDLVNHVALPDLAAAVTNFHIDDLLVLGDNTIVVAYKYIAFNQTPFLRRYASDGTLIQTILLTGSLSTEIRLATALDDPTSYWVWTRTNATETLTSLSTLNKFTHLRTSDAAVLTQFSVPQFIQGIYQGAKTATPLASFGAAESCPFLLLRQAIPLITGTIAASTPTTRSPDVPPTAEAVDGALTGYALPPRHPPCPTV